MTAGAHDGEIPADVAQRFSATAPLAHGETSVLYEGVDPTSGGAVLVKVLRDAAVPSTAERQRIVREAQKLAQVKHPALVRVVAAGESQGHLWIARERLGGRSLADLLADSGPMPANEVARIAAQVAAGLGELHRNGVLHRDVRPGHVIIDESGRARLLDAAIARVTKVAGGRFVMGTPGYVSPEAIAGKLVSFRSDLYSLGALMFELLHGAPPYGLPDAPNVLAQQTERDAPAVSVSVPPAMVKLIASLLAREPRERPFSAQQLERQLEPLASSDDDNGDGAASTVATSLEEIEAAAREDATTVLPPMSEISAHLKNAPPDELEDPPTQVSNTSAEELIAAARSAPTGSSPAIPIGARPSAAIASSPSISRATGAPTAGPPRKATMLGMMAPSTPARAPNTSAMAAAAMAPAMPRPVEGSGQRPAPADPNEFDEAIDTVVTEDSRIFGIPEVQNGSPHGSAVPPLPDAVAARVLTGSVKDAGPSVGGAAMGRGPATASMPATPSPQMAMHGAPQQMAPAGAFGMQGPPMQPGAMPSNATGGGWGPPPPQAPQGWNQSPQQHGAPNWNQPQTAPGGWNQQQPMVAPGAFAPNGQAVAPPAGPGYAPAQMPAAFGQQGFANQPTAPLPQGMNAPQGYAPQTGYPQYAQPTQPSRKSFLPWILAGIGVAGIAGASGYYFASRDRTAAPPISASPTPVVPVTNGNVVPGPAAPPIPAVAPPVNAVAVPSANVVPAPALPPRNVPPFVAPAPTPPPAVAANTAVPPPAIVANTPPQSQDTHHARSGSHDAVAAAPRTPTSYAQARAAADRHDYAQARTLASAAVREQPNSADAHALLADVLAHQNDASGALNELRAAARIAPRNTDYLHRIANIQVDRFDRAGATTTLRQILQINPRDAAAQRQLASLGGGTAPATTQQPAATQPQRTNATTTTTPTRITAPATNTTPTRTTAPATNTTTTPARTTPPTRRVTPANDPFVPTFGAPIRPGSGSRAGSIRR